MYINDMVYIIIHVRIMFLKELISVIVSYDSYLDRIKHFFLNDLKTFQICKQM